MFLILDITSMLKPSEVKSKITIDALDDLTCSQSSSLLVASEMIGKSVCIDTIERIPARIKSLLSARTTPILFRISLNKSKHIQRNIVRIRTHNDNQQQ